MEHTRMAKRIFISADHGLAVVYFLQSAVVDELIAAGLEVVLLTDDDLIPRANPKRKQSHVKRRCSGSDSKSGALR